MKNTFLFALINMFSGMGYSLVSPLFPSLGEKDHLSEELLGYIISAYSIAGTILTPLVPKLYFIIRFSHIYQFFPNFNYNYFHTKDNPWLLFCDNRNISLFINYNVSRRRWTPNFLRKFGNCLEFRNCYRTNICLGLL